MGDASTAGNLLTGDITFESRFSSKVQYVSAFVANRLEEATSDQVTQFI